MLKKCGCKGCYYEDKKIICRTCNNEINEIGYITICNHTYHENCYNKMILEAHINATETDLEIKKKLIEIVKNVYNLQNNKTECLHCGENAAAYCESCYQDLISKNAKLQLEIDTYKKARKEFEEEINKANMQVYSKFAKHIPRID